MGSPFSVIEGDEKSKEILVEILHTKGEKQTGLKEFLADLAETEERFGRFWVAMDKNENPRGALTVRYLEDTQMSYLRSIWTRVLRTEDQFSASKALLEAWMKDTNYEVKVYQADLPLYSPLTESIQRAGFEKQKMLMAYYDVETEWEVAELPSGYLMREVKKEELRAVYKSLVEPDLEPASPIYVSEERFLAFTDRIPIEAMESWVVVENEEGIIVGFAASFINAAPTQDGSDAKQAVLFGPHCTEASVQVAIIKEMMTYWKSKGLQSLRIIRSTEFYPSVEDALDLELVNSTVRFTLTK